MGEGIEHGTKIKKTGEIDIENRTKIHFGRLST